MSAAAPPQEVCGLADLGCKAREGIGDAIVAGASDAIADLAAAVAEALGKVLATLGTVWVSVETPNLTDSEAVTFIQDSLWFYMAGFAVLAVIIGGARMAWERRAAPGVELLRALLTLVVISGAGLTGIGLAVTAADGFAEWIIGRSTSGTDFGVNIIGLLALDGRVGTGLGPVLVIILGLWAIFTSFVQIMLMVARAGMLVILAGILPLTASFTSTEAGRGWLKKSLGWTFAFVVYKPAAAIVYATAFRLTGSNVFGDDGSGLMNVLVGLVLMFLALLALPALMRFVTPLVTSMAPSGGGGGAGLGAAAVAGVPTGAAHMGRGSASSGSSGGPGAPGGSGTSGASGTPGPTGSNGASPAPTPGRAGAAGASGAGTTAGAASASGAGATAGAASASGAGATAGTAGGPVGIAVGAVAGETAKAGMAAASTTRRTAQNMTNTDGGPDGSR